MVRPALLRARMTFPAAATPGRTGGRSVYLSTDLWARGMFTKTNGSRTRTSNSRLEITPCHDDDGQIKPCTNVHADGRTTTPAANSAATRMVSADTLRWSRNNTMPHHRSPSKAPAAAAAAARSRPK